MSWYDRLQDKIEFTSPEGLYFYANWVGDERSVQKKLGIFTYPKYDGEIIQDLGLAGTRYPLRIHFDGEDNDIEATRFFQAFSARGTWIVNHPTKGELNLQPVSVKENILPVESGSITVFDTEWIEPVPAAVVEPTVQLEATIYENSYEADDQALSQMDDGILQDTVALVNSVKTAVNKAFSIYDKTIASVLEFSGDLAAQAAAIRRGIASTLTSPQLDLTVLAGQIQSVMRLPAQITGDVLGTLQPYSDFIDQMTVLPDEVADQTYLNILAINELFLTSANTAMALASTSDGFTTRAQALEAADLVADRFSAITTALDTAQAQFAALRVDQQYFSQSLSFTISAQLSALAIKYLLEASFDLAVEKRFTLARQRAPIEITITEYGGLGVDDANLDLFIASNMLMGDEILVLPAGKEVVIYV